MTGRILVVEDDAALGTLLDYNLGHAGYAVRLAADGDEALMALDEETPDLVVLDWMLPGVSGLEICRRIRARSGTRDLPVIIVTARGEEEDRVRGLDTGADDYMTKPLSVTELMARIKAVLRRARPAVAGETASFGDITLDRESRRVKRAGREVRLGPTEFRLLRHFLEHPGRVFSREQLLDAVWGRDVYVEQRTVDVHIRRLRQALNTDDAPDLIRTVRSAGYALDTEAA